MLSRDDRSLLVDLLSPPDGYHLDHAVGTTFTLDLTALVAVPLKFAGADLAEETDPLTALQAVRTYADRIDVFCQAGQIAVPARGNDLLSFVEPIVHPVDRPRPGYLFHPKIWILRFVADDADSAAVDAFRLVCGSRNLTHDCAWDAAVTLDGWQTKRRQAVNNPLCDFVAALPDRSLSISDTRRDRIAALAESLHSVDWEPPSDVFDNQEWLQFHTFGRVKSRRLDVSGRRILVISPFVNDGGICRFDPTQELHVVSRGQELDQLEDAGRDWVTDDMTSLYVLNDDAAIPDIDDDAAGRQWSLNGLHAKVYVFERDRRAHLLIGSANATDAAWDGNDEFMVELVGRKNNFGIDTVVGENADFRSLLLDYQLGDVVPNDPDDDLRRALENALRDLSAMPLTATLEGSDRDGWEETLTSTTTLDWHVPNSELTISLLTMPAEIRSHAISTRVDSAWKLHALEDATPFVALRLRAAGVEVCSIVMAHLEGDQPDRLDRVLARQFKDQQSFLRFLLLLLSLAGGDTPGADFSLGMESGPADPWVTGQAGLLESLLKALARSPQSIDNAARLVERLQSTTEGQAVLPEGWEALWDAVLDARTRLTEQPT